jgi:hypothetical protein
MFGGMTAQIRVVEIVAAGKKFVRRVVPRPTIRCTNFIKKNCRGGGGVSISVVASTDAGSVESSFRRKIVARYYFQEEINVECDRLFFSTSYIACVET